MNIIVSHNRSTKFTKITLGKFFDKQAGQTLDKLTPLNIIRNDLNLKVQVAYILKQNHFAVTVNGIDYYSLPYVAPSSAGFGPEDIEILSA